MEIRASSIYDKKTIKTFLRMRLFYKGDPKKRMIIYVGSFAILILIVILFIIRYDSSPVLWLMMGISIFMILILLYLYFLMPGIRYKLSSANADMQNNYIFKDDEILCFSVKEGHSGESRLKYDSIFRATETSEFLYIDIDRTHTFIVDKATVEGGCWMDIRNKLVSVLGKKYIILKY